MGAAGVTLALLLVGTAVHYRTVHPASDAFVSAAKWESDKYYGNAFDVEPDALDPCPEPGMIYKEVTATGRANEVPVLADKDNSMPAEGIQLAMVVTKKACGCGAAVCTKGRICVKGQGGLGQGYAGKGQDKCYLPRCKNDKTIAIPGDIYTAGCFCGPSSLFTTSDPKYIINTATIEEPATVATVPACLKDLQGSLIDICSCGDQVCTKGQVCDEAKKTCDGQANDPLTDYKALGLYIHAMPFNFTNQTANNTLRLNFEICRNTNSQGDEACDVDGEVNQKCVRPVAAPAAAAAR